MNEKKCSKCHRMKNPATDFYLCSGQIRAECKQCTIKRNVKYQRKVKSWIARCGNEYHRRIYMREYYSKNKEKFAKYREEFRERYPNYYKNYFRYRKENGSEP